MWARPARVSADGSDFADRTQYNLAGDKAVTLGRFPPSASITPDVTAPTGTVQLAPLALAANASAFKGGRSAAFNDGLTDTLFLPQVMRDFCRLAPGPPNAMLPLSATDDASGVGSLEIGNDLAWLGANLPD